MPTYLRLALPWTVAPQHCIFLACTWTHSIDLSRILSVGPRTYKFGPSNRPCQFATSPRRKCLLKLRYSNLSSGLLRQTSRSLSHNGPLALRFRTVLTSYPGSVGYSIPVPLFSQLPVPRLLFLRSLFKICSTKFTLDFPTVKRTVNHSHIRSVILPPGLSTPRLPPGDINSGKNAMMQCEIYGSKTIMYNAMNASLTNS